MLYPVLSSACTFESPKETTVNNATIVKMVMFCIFFKVTKYQEGYFTYKLNDSYSLIEHSSILSTDSI
jgi:hypothetical protein